MRSINARSLVSFSLIGSLLLSCVNSQITIQSDSQDSLKAAAKDAADAVLSMYVGNQPGQVPGIFLPVDKYYWWLGGATWNAYIDYWRYTGDTSYNDIVTQALLFQVGPNRDYMPPNQTSSEGNDDHGFWGLAAMTAAEANFPNPPSDQPQWLALSQAVFNLMAGNWDNATCNGGLRWQIFPFNKGYDYKNSISNGCLFHLAARLARYTGNATYANWATTTFNWMQTIQLMTSDFSVHDGADVPDCTKIDYIQWTYNNGQFLAGSAFMYNYTNGDPYWKNNVDQLLANTFSKFFTNPANILFEPACEVTQTCNTDQTSFKGFLASYLAYVSQMAPYTAAQIYPYLATSAIAAGATCSGVGAGMTCSMQWTLGHYDGRERGVGEQLSLLNVVNSNLVKFTGAPVTHDSGGTSVGDPNAGSTGNPVIGSVTPATTGDKALAGVLTGSCAILLGLGGWLMIS